MAEALALQQTLFYTVTRALPNFKKIGKNNYTAAKVRQRMTFLKETWDDCRRTHAAILQAYPGEARAKIHYFEEDQYDQAEDVYQTAMDYMAECLEELAPTVSQNQSQTRTTVLSGSATSLSLKHLPAIQLPPFNGQFEDWTSFRDRFTSLIIKNKELTDFSRMHFLMSCVSGRAKDAIASLAVTADNFEIAWKVLTSRFENKRRLIEVQIAALFNLPTMSRESPTDLHALRDKVDKIRSSLNQLERSSDAIVDDILVYSISQRFDPATRRAWKLTFRDDDPPATYSDISSFISSRAGALDELQAIKGSKPCHESRATSSNVSTSVEPTCVLCHKRHFINKCSTFIDKSPSQRREIIKQHKRCINCMSSRHALSDCHSKFTCRYCQKRHHSMLHLDSNSSSNVPIANAPPTANEPSPAVTQVNSLAATSIAAAPSPVLLATARVLVGSMSGRSQSVRALIDPGSEVSFVTEKLAQALRLQRVRSRTTISAVGCVKVGAGKQAARLQISSRFNSGVKFDALAYILSSLTNYAPRRAPLDKAWTHLNDLNLADNDPTGSDPIDILIGAEIYGSIILDGIRKGEIGQPIAQNSHLGWLISGPTSFPSSISRSVRVLHCSLEQELKKFWEVEELPLTRMLSPDERLCEEHFLSTHSRDPTGRYIVRLPFKEGPPIRIGDSRQSATRMLAALNRRLGRNSALKEEYSAFLATYESLNHMIKVPPPLLTATQVVYIPHHAVVRESSSTTRLRVVFNGSSPTTNGTSLNSHLLPGPKLQTDIFDVLLRWRQHQYVYTADIAKMYRQILVDPRDQDYQRILWNGDDMESPQEYPLVTVTYGTASAPFLALRVLQQLIRDEGSAFPLASPVLKDNIYVDDVLFGAEDIQSLRHIRDQLCSLLARGGFTLRKWASNEAELLSDIPPDDHGLACNKLLRSDESLSILGLSWNPAHDVFQFKVSMPKPPPKSKRTVLSTIARLFDPLGWVTPVTISAKIFMQQLWKLGIDWDDDIPTQALGQWEAIYRQLECLDGLRLPRWIRRGSDNTHCELHGFADASSVAYAAAVYLRVTSHSGEVTTTLLAGKSRVAPIKPMTIPRLELSAVVLLSRLMEAVQTALNLQTVACHSWTDSTVVLAWLSKPASNWKTFVSHRVAAAQSRLPHAHWHHVPSQENPADCASRGLFDQNLTSYDLWWQGPHWLKLPNSEWPSQFSNQDFETQLDIKPPTVHLAQTEEPWELASRFSEWPKLIRVTAYLLRFLHRCRRLPTISEIKENPRALSSSECHEARLFWLKTIQTTAFADDIKTLKQGRPLSSHSKILALDPFLDRDGLIRVGGRLKNSPLTYSVRHPVLLSPHPVVNLIIRHVHVRLLHAGNQQTLSNLRHEYWLLRARNSVKAVLHQCVICCREKARVPVQKMGQLPQARVTAPARAFHHCGVDFAGPIAVRTSPGRGITSRKAYISLFVCLATRAIHLELVGNYSTSAFLDAYSRFCARRGLPAHMYSDNGTNFVGTDKELSKAYRASLRDPDFLNRIATDKVSWHFMPPHAPHFGGLWEAGVRSVKHHLRRTLGSHTLTFEELSTLLCRIEACLNSRPLGPLSENPDDYEPLTPGHFLIGSAVTLNPEPSLLHLNENRLSRWQLVRQITERFWKIWQTDYVNTLQQRGKWRKSHASIRVGTMVLLRNAMLPPCKWELGRVVRCFEGPDGLVRVVLVKTATSEYKRPLAQLCVLPITVDEAKNDVPPISS